MSIPKKVAATFAPPLRARGEEYFRAGLVKLVRADQSSVTATVRGTLTYNVEIRAVPEDRLDLQCTCPYALEYGVCKHIWATLLECERGGSLPTVADEAYHAEARAAREAARLAAQEAARLHEVARQAARDAAMLAVASTEPPPAVVPRALTPAADETRRWVQQLRAMAPTMSTSASEPRNEPVLFPVGRRLVYLVDVVGTIGRQDGLLVELASESLLKNGDWGPPRQFRLTRAQ